MFSTWNQIILGTINYHEWSVMKEQSGWGLGNISINVELYSQSILQCRAAWSRSPVGHFRQQVLRWGFDWKFFHIHKIPRFASARTPSWGRRPSGSRTCQTWTIPPAGNCWCLQTFSWKTFGVVFLPLWKQWGIPQSHPYRRHSSNPQLERKYESEHLILRSAGEKYHRVHRPMLSQIPLREVCQAFSRLVVPSTAETPMILESEVSKARSSLDVAWASSALGSATESVESGSCREEATWSSLRKEARSRLSREGCTFSTEALFTWCPSSPRSRTEARHRIGNLMSSRSESCDWMLEDTDRDTSRADTGRRV